MCCTRVRCKIHFASKSCERELMFTFAICCCPSVCRLSVPLMHPTQPVEIFHNVFTPFMPSVLWHCWLGDRKGIWPVKKWDGGGGHWLVRMEWRPAGWSVCLPLLISLCTIKSRSSLLAPAHPGGPGKRAVKRGCGGGCARSRWYACAELCAVISGRFSSSLYHIVSLRYYLSQQLSSSCDVPFGCKLVWPKGRLSMFNVATSGKTALCAAWGLGVMNSRVPFLSRTLYTATKPGFIFM